MNDIIPYQEVKLENQTVDEIVEDIGILKKIEETSKFEIGRRLVYLKETCKHGEYLPKLEDIGIYQSHASQYINFYVRFGKYDNCHTLGTGKIRELLRIPKGSEEEYLNKIPNPNEVTAKQLREEIDRLKQEKEQEKPDKEVSSINANLNVVIKRERKPIPETVKKSVRVRSRNSCERCGYNFTKFPIEEFHHINENPSDNRLDNILHLCPNCHALEHYILRGGILK